MFDDQTVLVTGGTGSFGKAFVKRLLTEATPRKVIVFSRDELKQHEMQQMPDYQDSRMRFFIGDVRDADRLESAMRGVDIIVHAAALKQVPAAEYNPIEAVRTNITGAENIVRASLNAGVKKVLALSTDKAVNASNLYGATKLVMEKLIIQANSYSGEAGTKFACVRYGNVIGSRGSVVPLFMKQKETGKVTVTDDRMTRFWITLDEGTLFVMESLEAMHGGEVFVPKLPSTNIMDIVEAVAPDCEVQTIGIRPAEKLHEIMVGADEARTCIDLGDRYVILPNYEWWTTPHEWNGKKGNPVEDGFEYASDSNTEWLRGQNLKKVLEENAHLS